MRDRYGSELQWQFTSIPVAHSFYRTTAEKTQFRQLDLVTMQVDGIAAADLHDIMEDFFAWLNNKYYNNDMNHSKIANASDTSSFVVTDLQPTVQSSSIYSAYLTMDRQHWTFFINSRPFA